MSSQFDPQQFLDVQLTEPSVKRPPIPVGEYPAIIGEVKSRAWQGKADPTKSGIAFDVPLTVELPPSVAAVMGQPNVVIGDSIMLDLTPNGAIDNAPGKNRKLRAYREALDMNKAGDSFSARAMQGRVVKVMVSHDINDGKKDPMRAGEIYERIQAIARA